MKQNSAVAGRRHSPSVAGQLDLFQPQPKPTRALTAVEKFRAELAAYRRTAAWKRKRSAKLKQIGRQCERCGSWTGRRDVHHKTYPERLGDERVEDLIVLCTRCHEIEDERRAAEAKRRAAEALDSAIFYNGLDTYMTNRYGWNWQKSRFARYAEREFAEWLEEKEYREWNGW